MAVAPAMSVAAPVQAPLTYDHLVAQCRCAAGILLRQETPAGVVIDEVTWHGPAPDGRHYLLEGGRFLVWLHAGGAYPALEQGGKPAGAQVGRLAVLPVLATAA